jgi:hypothetical protein
MSATEWRAPSKEADLEVRAPYERLLECAV